MTDKKVDELKSSEYDGIQEYDNDLPRWWVGTFILSVLFGFGYWFYYHTFSGPDQIQRYDKQYQAYQEKYLGAQEDTQVTDESLRALLDSARDLQQGKEVYTANCVACHLESGGGSIGPNLTDEYWIHGASPTDIHEVIVNGVVEKGMLAWKGILTSKQIEQVTAYLLTLKDTHVQGGKEPEGELVQ